MGKEKGMRTSAFASSGVRVATVLSMCLLGIVSMAWAFGQDATSQANVAADPQQNTAAPLTLTLQDALARARKINPEYHAALTELGIAKEDRVQSRAALLPNVTYNTAFLYTEGNHTPTGRFIAANGVHEHQSQGNAHQVISLENLADYRRLRAAEAVARARAEIATRGLVVTVVRAYYGFIVAQRKYASVQRAAADAQHFLDISQKLEHGGEVAHSDVVKAQNQARQEVAVAWNRFLPSLSFDYFYGIDANQFAIRAPNGDRNLGYAATASLQLPLWNWGANRSKVKQANLRRQQANIELTATQRELLSNLRIFYNEAQTARAELDSLNQSAELAAESLRLTTLRYQAGEATALEVVDAQNTLTQSRNALNDGQARFRVALANLQTLTGTL